jgi:3-oxoacyl-[acyl-carrier protein] reductase
MTQDIQRFMLAQRHVIVTGAAQGVGLAVARNILGLGGRVTAVDVNAQGLRELHGQAPDRVQTFVGSVADREFVDRVVGECGPIDGLVNNAGIVRAAMLHKMTADQWNEVLSINLTGVFTFLQAVSIHMLARSKSEPEFSGAIVNVASDAGRRGTMGQINYGAAKSGVLGITMSAARELCTARIRVNTVCFGVVETPMTETLRGEKFREGLLKQIPMGRWASAEEAARPVCFLLSDAASYITGQHLSVNGGLHIGF